jgi:hypothetical protein
MVSSWRKEGLRLLHVVIVIISSVVDVIVNIIVGVGGFSVVAAAVLFVSSIVDMVDNAAGNDGVLRLL